MQYQTVTSTEDLRARKSRLVGKPARPDKSFQVAPEVNGLGGTILLVRAAQGIYTLQGLNVYSQKKYNISRGPLILGKTIYEPLGPKKEAHKLVYGIIGVNISIHDHERYVIWRRQKIGGMVKHAKQGWAFRKVRVYFYSTTREEWRLRGHREKRVGALEDVTLKELVTVRTRWR